MTDFIVVVVLLLILGTAVTYIVKEKRKGTVCIGCPHAGTCTGKKGICKESLHEEYNPLLYRERR